MFLEFYRKRKANAQRSICFYNGGGQSVILPFGEPVEVPDEFGYKILGENSDIVRRVEIPKETEPEPKKKKRGKKTKVVEQYSKA